MHGQYGTSPVRPLSLRSSELGRNQGLGEASPRLGFVGDPKSGDVVGVPVVQAALQRGLGHGRGRPCVAEDRPEQRDLEALTR